MYMFVDDMRYYNNHVSVLIAIFIISIICTILTLALITPEKRRADLPRFFQFCHDLFNVKWLLIEKIFKTLYIFNTLFIILYGFTALFVVPFMGTLMIFVGPILVRLLHEILMLGILTVKSLISINNKMPASGTGDNPFSASFSEYRTSAPASNAAPASNIYTTPASNIYTAPVSGAASAPGTAPASMTCKNCGAQLEPGVLFCGQCGHKNG